VFEVVSLAGHLKLKNLIVFFDNNKISIDGSTSLAVSDNYKKRFESYGWLFQEVNGHNEKQILKAIKKSLNSKKPNLISCKTIIGYGSPNKSGKESSHGSALGEEEVALVRKKLQWKHEPFKIPKEILNEWRKIGEKGILEEKKWNSIYNKKDKKIRDEITRITNNKLPGGFDEHIASLKKKIFDLKSDLASRKFFS
jgi:transketolase